MDLDTGLLVWLQRQGISYDLHVGARCAVLTWRDHDGESHGIEAPDPEQAVRAAVAEILGALDRPLPSG